MCKHNEFCYNNVTCSNKCSKSPMNGNPGDGDGIRRGNCKGKAETCTTKGNCEGIFCHALRIVKYFRDMAVLRLLLIDI